MMHGGKWWMVILFVAGVAGGTSVSFGATLSIATTESRPGKTGFDVPVTMTGLASHQVAAIQFDLSYDPRVLSVEKVSPGAAAAEAAKSVSSYGLASGKERIMLIGMNQNILSEGTVAVLHVRVADGAVSGVYPLEISNQVFADPVGREAEVRVAPGAVLVGVKRETPDAEPVQNDGDDSRPFPGATAGFILAAMSSLGIIGFIYRRKIHTAFSTHAPGAKPGSHKKP